MRWAGASTSTSYYYSFAASFLLVPFVSMAPMPPSVVDRMNILEYNTDAAYTKFEFDVNNPSYEPISPLIFEVQVNAVNDPYSSDLLLNGQSLDLVWTRTRNNELVQPANLVHSAHSLLVRDTHGLIHDVDVSLYGNILRQLGSTQDNNQSVHLAIDSIDGVGRSNLGLVLVMRPTQVRRLVSINIIQNPAAISFDEFPGSFVQNQPAHDVTEPFDDVDSSDMDANDMEADIQSLLNLEAAAADLQAQIALKKQRIEKCLKRHREETSLRHLLDQCDGIVCAAKVIAQRICDKIGIDTQSSIDDLIHSQSSMQQHVALNEESAHLLGTNNSTGSRLTSKPATGTGNAKPSTSHVNAPGDFINAKPFKLSNAIFGALGMVAALLGLTALFAFLRRRFSSARTQVERAADYEERNNARAYRRAARRALYRKRWDSFVATWHSLRVTRSAPLPPVKSTYEEKRALILQDALLEQDADLAEKGEVMEAEIRELRHAHEIVSSLVRVDDHRYAVMGAARHDPPPPFVPLPYTPSVRSRASSGTLPSYNSECLPGYTSAPLTDTSSRRSNSITSITDGFQGYSPTMTAATTVSQDEPRPLPIINAPSSVAGSRCSRYTPTSSVADVSPRPSQETLRTRLSREDR